MNHEDSTREKLFAEPDEIIALAQAYYATEFPNSARRGCQPADVLREIERSGKLPDARLRAHLFNCSECFRSFRSARISHRSQTAANETWWHGLAKIFATGRTVIVASVLSLVLLIMTADVFLPRTGVWPMNIAINNPPRGNAVPSAQTDAAPAIATAVTNNTTASVPQLARTRMTRDADPQRAKKIPRSARTTATVRVIEINLEEENLLRDGDEVTGKPRLINLAPQRQRLRLQLPEGSASGRYAVNVVDAFGKPLITTSAISNGKTLMVFLDLRSLTAKKYRLCIARSGEAPDCYLVNVNDQTHRATK